MLVATAAATAAPAWKLSPTTGEEVSAALSPAASGKVEATPNLLFTTKGGTKVAISCTSLSTEAAKLEGEGKTSGTLSFGGCQTLLNGTLAKNCEPHSGASKGVIKTNALKGLLVPHEGTSLVRIEPASGTLFVTIELSELCSIGENAPVAGTFYAKASNGQLEALKVTHLFEQGPLTSITALSNAATLDGSASFSLSGAHAGREWKGAA